MQLFCLGGHIELAVVSVTAPHEVFASTALKTPNQGDPVAVATMSYATSTVLVRVEPEGLESLSEAYAMALETDNAKQGSSSSGQTGDVKTSVVLLTGIGNASVPFKDGEGDVCCSEAANQVKNAKDVQSPDAGDAETAQIADLPECKVLSPESAAMQPAAASECCSCDGLELAADQVAPMTMVEQQLKMQVLAQPLVQHRSSLKAIKRGPASTHFALCQAVGEQDLTTIPDFQIEEALRQDIPLPGWDYKADPRKHLAYMKIYFDCVTMAYKTSSIWSTGKVPSRVSVKVRDLLSHMELFMSKTELVNSLSEHSRFDLEVAWAWLKLASQDKVAHGPLLGWGKMQGHEFYMHEWDAEEPSFLMVREVGKTYKESLNCIIFF